MKLNKGKHHLLVHGYKYEKFQLKWEKKIYPSAKQTLLGTNKHYITI